MRRMLCVCAGNASLSIGIAGVFVPLLPTIPFLLLAAYFYAQGSTRINHWMQTHPRLARSIRMANYYGILRPSALLIPLLLRGVWRLVPLLLKGAAWLAKPFATLMAIMIAHGIDGVLRWAAAPPRPTHNQRLPQFAGIAS